MRKHLLASILLLSAVGGGLGCHSKDQELLDASGRSGQLMNPAKIKALLMKGADVNAVGRRGRQPLHYAAQRDNLDAVKLLLAAGAKVDAVDEDGYQPLHYAAQKMSGDPTRLVNVLLAAGAKVDAMDKSGYQPIHHAAMHSDAQIHLVQTLLAAGAKVDAANKAGLQPLHCAALNGRTKIVELLLAHGAKASAKTHDGELASAYADQLWSTFSTMGGTAPSAQDKQSHQALAAFLKGQEAKEAAASLPPAP